MAHQNLQHRRTHNSLLISRLLNQREGASPFTLILDTLEQAARPLLREYIRRANLGKSYTTFVSFNTPRKLPGVDNAIIAWNKTPTQILSTLAASIDTSTHPKRHLILIDSLNSLCAVLDRSNSHMDLTTFLSSLIRPSQPSDSNSSALTSVVAVYHTDIPIISQPNPYVPSPLQLLSYLATTTITMHSLPVLLAHKRAHERSLGPPSFGLEERKDGVLIGLKKSLKKDIPLTDRGVVLEVEHKRKSGRGVRERYFLPASPPSTTKMNTATAFREHVLLLDDHPLLRQQLDNSDISDQELNGLTFELGLTNRQKADREGVVLPYFDAQNAELGGTGPGDGGRILYDMGVEDDFDEEEDEI